MSIYHVEREEPHYRNLIPGLLKLLGAVGTGLLIGSYAGSEGAIVGGVVGGTVFSIERLAVRVEKWTQRKADEYTSRIKNL